jgi:hypothetical protein
MSLSIRSVIADTVVFINPLKLGGLMSGNSRIFTEIALEYPEQTQKIMSAIDGLSFKMAIYLLECAIDNLRFISGDIIFSQNNEE